MWLPDKAFEFFHISKDTVSALREDVRALTVERDTLKHQLSVSQNHFDWLRMQVNTLQLEKTALLEKAYNIKLPAPEIVRTPVIGANQKAEEFTFEDIGDAMAKQLGLPAYTN